MTLQTSLFKGGIFRYQVKRFWWISLVYTLALFLTGPYILIGDKEYYIGEALRSSRRTFFLFDHSGGAYFFMLLAVFFVGICMIMYLQKARSATLFHALPVTRKQLYITSFLAGGFLTLIPFLINGFIFLMLSLFGDFALVVPVTDIVYWLLGFMVTSLSFLAFVMFVGLFTGSSVAQGAFAIILCLLPVGVFGLVFSLLDGWLFGFSSLGQEGVYEFLLQVVPCFYPQFFTQEPTVWIFVLQCVYSILFLGLGLYVYEKRQVECTGDVVAFSWLKPVFLYGVTFCVMLAGTCFVMGIDGDLGETAPSLFIFLIFAILGYAGAKMLLTKSFRVWQYYKGFLAYALIILCISGVVHYDVLGYGSKLPAGEDVLRASVGNYYMREWREIDLSTHTGHDGYAFFKERENVEKVLALHEEKIRTTKHPRKKYAPGIYISYELANGRKMLRWYEGNPEELYALFSTKEAKDGMYPVLRTRPEDVEYICLNPDRQDEVYIHHEERDALIQCLREDLDRLTYEEIQNHIVYEEHEAKNGGYVQVVEKTSNSKHMTLVLKREDGDGFRNIWFTYNENFTKTMQWLKAKGYTI